MKTCKCERAEHYSLYKHEMYTANSKIKLFIPRIAEDTVNRRQTSSLRLADLREIPVLWGEQLKKFYGLVSSVTHIYCNRS